MEHKKAAFIQGIFISIGISAIIAALIYVLSVPKIIFFPYPYQNVSLEQLLNTAVNERAFPGGTLIIGDKESIYKKICFGYHSYRRIRPTKKNDLYDLASLSKVISTTSAIMKLHEIKTIDIDDPVFTYLPQFTEPSPHDNGKRYHMTIRHLLNHTSGLRAWRPFYRIDFARTEILRSRLHSPPGTVYTYSDINAIFMGKIIEQVSGQQLNRFCEETLFKTMLMNSTYYTPGPDDFERSVPTEISVIDNTLVKGRVHDENASFFGGVSGHAGLFSTADDLARFAQVMLNNGILSGKRYFEYKTIKLFTTYKSNLQNNPYHLGWKAPSGISSAGLYADPHSYGHTGFTGTSLWIDPENEIFVILLSNAVHPHRNNRIPHYFDWRQLIHTKAYEYYGITKRNRRIDIRERWKKSLAEYLFLNLCMQ